MLSLIVTSLVLLPDVSAAQSIEVLEAGWGGTAVPGRWTPVRLRVKAGVEELRGVADVVVEAELPTGPKSAPLRMPIGSYGQEINLRAGETRELTVWFPAASEMGIRARLTERDETRAETTAPMKMVRQDWPAIAVFAEGAAIARAVRAIELPYQGLPIPVVVADLAADEIPRSGRLLEAITGMVVQGSGAADLTDAQRRAVLEWVRGGGHLVVTGGPAAAHATKVIPDGSLSIGTIEFRGAADIGALAAWAGTAGMPRSAPVSSFRADGGVVLAGTADRPLAWRTRVGKGSVTVLAIDPALEPIASWADATAFWRIALAPALSRASSNEGQSNLRIVTRSSQMMDNASMLPIDAHPDWRLAAGILLLFAFVVGPVLYVVLRRIDRNELRWIAVPIAALLFSVAAFVVGAKTSGKQGITNIASFIDVDAGGQSARHAIVAAFYGPMMREVSLPLPNNVPVRASTEASASLFPWSPNASPADSARVRASSVPPFQVIDGTERRVRFNGSRFALRQISFDRELVEIPRIRAQVTLEGGLLSGTVRNESKLPLDHAVVMIGTSVARLGSIASGQSVPIRLDPQAAEQLPQYTPLSVVLFSTPKQNRPSSQSGYVHYTQSYEAPDDPETRRRARFVDRVMGREMSSVSWTMPLTLFAFTPAPTVGDVLPLSGKNVHELTMLRIPVEVLLPPGRFVFPAAFNQPEMLESTGMNSMGSVRLASSAVMNPIELRGGAVTYAFRPPLPSSARVETLLLKTEQLDRTAVRNRAQNPNIKLSAAAVGVFSIYNWQRGAWQPLPEGSEHKLAAGAYVGPGGEVRVRVATGQDQIVVFVEPSLVIEGVVGAQGAR